MNSDSSCQLHKHVIAMYVLFYYILSDQGDASRPTLEDVMIFLTGCRNVPPSGFNVQPTIFFDDNQIGMPVVSTCALSITFPTRFPVEQGQFNHKMDLAVLSAKDNFGLI